MLSWIKIVCLSGKDLHNGRIHPSYVNILNSLCDCDIIKLNAVTSEHAVTLELHVKWFFLSHFPFVHVCVHNRIIRKQALWYELFPFISHLSICTCTCAYLSYQDRLADMKYFHSCMCVYVHHPFWTLPGAIQKDDAHVFWPGP